MARAKTTYTFTATPAPAKRKRGYNGLRRPACDVFTSLRLQWRSLSGVQQAGFASLGARMGTLGAQQENRPMSGYQCYMSLGTARWAQGLSVNFDPPPGPEAVPFINNFSVAATSAVSHRPSPAEFQITLHADPIAVPVQVFIAAPSATMSKLPRAQDYKSVGVINGIAAGGTDITALYLKKYDPVGYAYKIAVRLVPLSPSGFRGQPVMAMGEVGPAASK